MSALEDKLVQYIDEAYAMEQHVLRLLDSMIATTDDPQMKRSLERHRKQTEKQAERLESRLTARRASPSRVKQAGGMIGALTKAMVDLGRGDKAARNARDGFATEHMEIASYELLERVAKLAGDKETVAVARQNREEEEAMARAISSKWNKIVDLSLQEEGIKVPSGKKRPARRASSSRAKATAAKAPAGASASTRSSTTRASSTGASSTKVTASSTSTAAKRSTSQRTASKAAASSPTRRGTGRA
jgi:ferritin-like metal-binding protein YciE